MAVAGRIADWACGLGGDAGTVQEHDRIRWRVCGLGGGPGCERLPAAGLAGGGTVQPVRGAWASSVGLRHGTRSPYGSELAVSVCVSVACVAV